MYGINQTPRNYSGAKGFLRKIRDKLLIKRNHISTTYNAPKLQLQTGFSLKSAVMEINRVEPGEYVGYGGTYVTDQQTRLAICPVGYADGLSPNYNNCQVIINDQRYNVVGMVDMCMITIKVDDNVKVGDEITLIGDGIPIKEVASKTGATVYATMTTISKEIVRVYR
jgi:alanine racemase